MHATHFKAEHQLFHITSYYTVILYRTVSKLLLTV